ncbi:TPA: hypothetical protein JAZ56_02960 [Legionella pneumophila]|nr:hypothetical protein [Legionella pneumophila]
MGKITTARSTLTVDFNSDYVQARYEDNRKTGWFEVIVGECMLDNAPT